MSAPLPEPDGRPPETPPATSVPPGDNMRRHLAVAFGLAAAFYVTSFWWIQHRRVVNGPWEIGFVSDAAAHPSLQIAQQKLHISEKLVFPDDQVDQTNFSRRVVFSEATTNLPFGEMLMQDALYLPGTVTLRLCGHQVEILPRALIVDKKEHAWQTGQEVIIPKTAPP